MAPTSALSALISTATGTASAAPINPPPAQSTGFAGDEFSNNLFSDLAPLLTLFGEQVTKQFLSMSMGWADHIVLAMGPLGILTIVVSAIRVSGVKQLKALIGRARESQAAVEQELLSSTSENVCELWNGREIVRVVGQSKTLELVLYKSKQDGAGLVDLEEAVRDGWLRGEYALSWVNPVNLSHHTPNIALNANPHMSRVEVRLWACFGVVVQSTAVVIPAMCTYEWKWLKGTVSIPPYAYPCFLAGFITLATGIALCSRIIDSATVEETLVPGNNEDGVVKEVFRVQMSCTVGDEQFPTCLMWNPPGDRSIRISRLRPNRRVGFWTVLATFLAITGFILQFVGLRALHWSATIMQLATILIMTASRSWIRRGLAQDPRYRLLPRTIDLIALYVGSHCDSVSSDKRTDVDEGVALTDDRPAWEIVTGGYRYPGINTAFPSRAGKRMEACLRMFSSCGNPRHCDIRIDLRSRLVKLDGNPGRLADLANRLQNATHRTLGKLERDPMVVSHALNVGYFSSSLPLATDTFQLSPAEGSMPHVSTFNPHTLLLDYRRLDRAGRSSMWKPSQDTDAILSLCVASMERQDQEWRRALAARRNWHRTPRYFRTLGDCASFSFQNLKDLPQTLSKQISLGPRPNGLATVPYAGGKPHFVPRHRYKDVPRAAAFCWPVFGVNALTERDQAEKNDEMIKSLFAQGTACLYQIDEAKRNLLTTDATCLLILSDLPLENQFALDIFGIMLDALAKDISEMPVQTTPYSYPLFTEIAEILVSESLVNDLDEALAIVVPPFLRHGLPKMELDGGSESTSEPGLRVDGVESLRSRPRLSEDRQDAVERRNSR